MPWLKTLQDNGKVAYIRQADSDDISASLQEIVEEDGFWVLRLPRGVAGIPSDPSQLETYLLSQGHAITEE